MKTPDENKASFWEELKLIGRLWPFMKPERNIILLAMLSTPIISITGLLPPYLTKQAIDIHFIPQQYEGIEIIALQYLATIIVGYLFSVGYSIALSWAGMKMLVRLREFLYDRVLSLPLSFFDKRPAGMLLTRLTNDVDALSEVIGAGIVTIVLDVLMVVGCLGVMLWLDVKLTFIMLLCSPILLGLVELVRRQLRRLYIQIRDSISAVNSFLAEQIDGVEILQLFGSEERSKSKFDLRNLKFRDAAMESNIYDSLIFALVDGMASVFIALLLWYGSGDFDILGLQWAEVQSAGLMVAFVEYLNLLLRPIRDISQKISVIQRSLASLSKIFALVDEAEPMDLSGQNVPNLAGHIQLKNVSFSYSENGDDVLKGISLVIHPGEIVALVGSSGSGKTTLSRLLDRSYIGYRGSILVDGQELAECAIPSIRQQIVSVRQDIQIFSRSLWFNIALEKPDIDQSKAEMAAKMTCADSFIARLGWEKVLRERGADLSVGEGQLLTFARTMAADSAVVILDEATASVDSVTEGQIQQAIENIFAEKTVIVIAHRLSTIQQADRIVVLEKGEIVEQGNHQELLEFNGRYAELVAAGKAAVG